MKRFNRHYSLSSLIFSAIGGFLLGVILMPERIVNSGASSSSGSDSGFFIFSDTPRVASRRDPSEMDLSWVEFRDPPIKYKKVETPAKKNQGFFASLASDYDREMRGMGDIFSSSNGIFGDSDDALYFGKKGGKRQYYGTSLKSSLLPPQLSWLSAFLPI